MNKEFYIQFNKKDQLKLKGYFSLLSESIFLSNRERKLFIEDFENAITYYHEKKMSVDKIIKLLDLENLGTYYKDDATKWYPLDNAAKIYPLSMKANWMSVFRLSCYLKDDIVPEILQIALNFTIKRFPTFSTSIRKGFFWNYIDAIRRRFPIYEDNKVPCRYMNVSNLGKQSFKTLYYKNKISVEFFHILTDGYGGTVFLLTLVNEYLRLLGKEVNYSEITLDVNEKPNKEELTDEFTNKEQSLKTKSLVDSKALELDGKLSDIRPCQLLHFDIKVDELKSLAKAKKATITELMLTFIFMTCSYSTSKDGYIKIQVPVNMRKYYETKTLRNFALYVVISIKQSDINDFDKVLKIIKKQMKEKNNQQYLHETMTYTNRLVSSIRYIPLFIKRPVASLVYGYLGDKVLTTVFSNLGNININDSLKRNIKTMDFCLGTGITNKVLFSMITCNGVATLTISKYTTNSSIENNLYNLMEKYNLNLEVYGSEIYASKKSLS